VGNRSARGQPGDIGIVGLGPRRGAGIACNVRGRLEGRGTSETQSPIRPSIVEVLVTATRLNCDSGSQIPGCAKLTGRTSPHARAAMFTLPGILEPRSSGAGILRPATDSCGNSGR